LSNNDDVDDAFCGWELTTYALKGVCGQLGHIKDLIMMDIYQGLAESASNDPEWWWRSGLLALCRGSVLGAMVDSTQNSARISSPKSRMMMWLAPQRMPSAFADRHGRARPVYWL